MLQTDLTYFLCNVILITNQNLFFSLLLYYALKFITFKFYILEIFSKAIKQRYTGCGIYSLKFQKATEKEKNDS